MSSYLPEQSYVICTNHIGTGYRQLQIDKDRRPSKTVYLGKEAKLFLVEVDIKIDDDFNCKTQWNSVVSNAMFGGGAVGGLLVAGAAIGLAIPGPGWVVSAICVGAIAVGALVGGLIGYFSNKRKCSDLLSSCGTSWQLPHPTVKFDKLAALTKTSFIQCQEGGQLLPFVSEQAAKDAAFNVFLFNAGELATNGVVSAIGGFLLTNGLTSIWAAVYGLGSLGASYIIGTEVMPLVFGAQADSIREKSEYDNADDYYQRMNASSSEHSNKEFDCEVQGKSSDASTLYGDQPIGIYDQAKGLPKNDDNLKDNNKAKDIYDKALENSKQNKSNSAKNNPELAEQMKKDNKIFTNKNGTRNGTNNSKRHTIAGSQYNSKANWNKARIGAGIVTIVAPFGGFYLGEKARDAAASYAIKDMDFLSVDSVNW